MKTKVLTSLSGALLCLFCVGCAGAGPGPCGTDAGAVPLDAGDREPDGGADRRTH